MCEEKRKNDRPAEGGTLNSGRRMAPDVGEIYLQRPNDFQPIEGVARPRTLERYTFSAPTISNP